MSINYIIMLCIGLTTSSVYCTLKNNTQQAPKHSHHHHNKVAGQGAGPVEREWYEVEVAKRIHRGEKPRNYGPTYAGASEFLIFGDDEYYEIIPNPAYEGPRSMKNKNYSIFYKEPVKS